MKVLVTGSCGFIGINLVSLLHHNGYDVLGIDIKPPRFLTSGVTFELCDILNINSLKQIVKAHQPDFVIHLAARTDLNERRDINGYAVNIDGTKNLIEIIRNDSSVKRCIYTSSQLVCSVGYNPLHCQDYCPTTLYGESKVLAERAIRQYDGGGKEWCIIRPTTIWGPWMNGHYKKFIDIIKKGVYYHIGSKEQFKSYGYVKNSCYQIMRLLEAPYESIDKKVFYLADYEPISLRKWADLFQEELNAPKIRTMPIWAAKSCAIVGDFLKFAGFRQFPITSFRLNNILSEYIYDVGELKKIVSGIPYTIEDGVKETVRWYFDEYGS